MWSFFKRKPKEPGRAQKYVYIVSLDSDITGVTTRGKMRVEATSKEAAKVAALDQVQRRSGISLRSSDILRVSGGRRRA